MTEPTPLSAEEERLLRRTLAQPSIDTEHLEPLVPRLLATLDAARTTVPAADADRERLAQLLHAAIDDAHAVGWDDARTTDLRPETVHAAIDAVLSDG